MSKQSVHNPLWPHTGAILCGGKSSRMGIPKAAIVLSSGLTMIEHVYQALKAICRQVVLVGHKEGIPPHLWFLTRIEDRYKDKGPLGGLEALLSFGIDSTILTFSSLVSDIEPASKCKKYCSSNERE